MMHKDTKYMKITYLCEDIGIRMKASRNIITVLVMSVMALWSCSQDDIIGPYPDSQYEPVMKPSSGHVPVEEPRSVFLLYAAGHNNLYHHLSRDIQDLTKGWLPDDARGDNVLLVYSHIAKNSYSYNEPTAPALIRVSSGPKGTDQVRMDTLMVYERGTVSSSAEQVRKVLDHVREHFPAKSYGMGFSSHSTGYIPDGYIKSHDTSIIFSARQGDREGGMHKQNPLRYIDAENPLTKTIGHDDIGSEDYEMDLVDFAQAIPMKLDYLLFDTCLMGGIEVAYELRDKCRFIGFSQTEVASEGFDYTSLTRHLLQGEEPDPLSVCQDYFEYYDKLTGSSRSATISYIDCSRLEGLAEVCKEIFSNNRDGLSRIKPSDVQGYFNYNWHWFYDLEDIIVKAGAGEDELADLQEALEGCVIYKAHTPMFRIGGSFKIDTHSGFSMYLPCDGDADMDTYYKTLQWNKDTGLVQ